MIDTPSADAIRENPFYVLELRPGATRAEIERQAQKLLGMLELGLARAALYATPLGPCERTADLVRRAVAELRDPTRRLRHELWAALPAEPVAEPATAAATGAHEPRTKDERPDPFVALGFRAPRGAA